MQAFWFVFKATEIKIILFVAEGGAFACVLVKRPRLICRGCYLTVVGCFGVSGVYVFT